MNMSAPVTTPLVEITGVLIRNAEARMVFADRDAQLVPGLVMHLRIENSTHNHACIEQPFVDNPTGFEQCKAAARRYRKGMRVTVQAPVAWASLHLRHTAHIHIVQPTTEETTV